MSWQSLYQSRTMSAAQAVACVQSEHRVFVGSNGAEPQTLVEALAALSAHVTDVEILHILTLGCAPYSAVSLAEQFRHNALFIGANVREAVNSGRADYTPIFLSEVPQLFRQGCLPLDIALIQVSPPDLHGYCSLGISVDVVRAAVDCARFVVAEVNPRMPRTHGDTALHVSRIHAFVESDRPLLELPLGPQNDVTRRIGRFIADLIEDGSTLQLGIGAIPDAVLACLGDRRDLGLHTEMFSDGILPLVEAGVLTGARKSLQREKIVASFCMGTRALYDFVHDNPAVEFLPTEYINDPFVIAQQEKMVAINAALEVDLTGQVCADSIGERFYSGIGGQVDFLRGAARSHGGKPIIALPSTATLKEGTRISRIVPTLQTGAGVVTSRGDVHYLVTEWGVVSLHGKSVRERALALIQVAHPDFRPGLIEAAKARHLLPADQPECGLRACYPEALVASVCLPEGLPVLVRPVRPSDEGLLRAFLARQSGETVFSTPECPLPNLPHSERAHMVNVDYRGRMGLAVVHREGEHEVLLGIAHWQRQPTEQTADITLSVRDDWEERGVREILLRHLKMAACSAQLPNLTACVQPEHRAMHALLLQHGFAMTGYTADGACLFRYTQAPVSRSSPP